MKAVEGIEAAQAISENITMVQAYIGRKVAEAVEGTFKDITGNPVPRPGGGCWDHLKEMNDTLRGLRNHAETLKGVSDPAAQAARQRALDTIQRIESAFMVQVYDVSRSRKRKSNLLDVRR